MPGALSAASGCSSQTPAVLTDRDVPRGTSGGTARNPARAWCCGMALGRWPSAPSLGGRRANAHCACPMFHVEHPGPTSADGRPAGRVSAVGGGDMRPASPRRLHRCRRRRSRTRPGSPPWCSTWNSWSCSTWNKRRSVDAGRGPAVDRPLGVPRGTALSAPVCHVPRGTAGGPHQRTGAPPARCQPQVTGCVGPDGSCSSHVQRPGGRGLGLHAPLRTTAAPHSSDRGPPLPD
jgi:hypothetical protein